MPCPGSDRTSCISYQRLAMHPMCTGCLNSVGCLCMRPGRLTALTLINHIYAESCKCSRAFHIRHAQSNQHCLKHTCPKSADTDQATQINACGRLICAWLITCCKHAVCKMQITVSNWSMQLEQVWRYHEVQSAQAPAVGVASP